MSNSLSQTRVSFRGLIAVWSRSLFATSNIALAHHLFLHCLGKTYKLSYGYLFIFSPTGCTFELTSSSHLKSSRISNDPGLLHRAYNSRYRRHIFIYSSLSEQILLNRLISNLERSCSKILSNESFCDYQHFNEGRTKLDSSCYSILNLIILGIALEQTFCETHRNHIKFVGEAINSTISRIPTTNKVIVSAAWPVLKISIWHPNLGVKRPQRIALLVNAYHRIIRHLDPGLKCLFTKFFTQPNLTLCSAPRSLTCIVRFSTSNSINRTSKVDMSDVPITYNISKDLEHELLYPEVNLHEGNTPALEESIYEISGELYNLSVNNEEIVLTTANGRLVELSSEAEEDWAHQVESEHNSTQIENPSNPIVRKIPKLSHSSPQGEAPKSLFTKPSAHSHTHQNISGANPKRRLDASSQELANHPKKFKPFDSLRKMFPTAAAVAATQAFVVDILPDGEAGELFTDSQGKAIKNSFTRALFSDENMGKLHFENSGLERGRFRIICTDEATRDWTVGIVPKLEGLWQGARIKSVASGPPPVLVRATVTMALPTPEPNDFFNIIAAQNPTINTSNWKLISRSKAQNGKQQWVIGIEEISINALRDLDNRPYCGMTRVRIFLANNGYNAIQP